MQVWKNKMLHKSIKQYPREIKPHITSHFIEFWARDGSARLFNTYMLEAAHPQQVKNVYHGSSRRRGTILSEMFLRYIRMKLVKQGKAEFNRVRGNDDMLRRLQNFDSDSRDSKIRFETEAGILFMLLMKQVMFMSILLRIISLSCFVHSIVSCFE
jgi:hypothetical protein